MGATTGHSWRLPEQSTQPPDVVLWLGNLGNDIDADFTDLEAVVDSHTAALVKLGLSGKRVVVAYAVSGVSPGGTVTVNFPSPFAGNPIVLPMLADTNAIIGSVVLDHSTVTPSQFQVQCVRRDGATATGGSVRIGYIAVGTATTAELLPAGEGVAP